MDAGEQGAIKKPDYLGWKPSWLCRRDGKDGWVIHPAQVQFLHWPSDVPYWHRDFQRIVPYGVAQIDNGEIILVGTVGNVKPEEKPVVAVSGDGGESWTRWRKIDDSASGRPTSLTYLGAGEVMFAAEYENQPMRFFSKDNGRTWPERAPVPLSSDGRSLVTEGNYLVDRDENGMATRIAAFGWMGPAEYTYPVDAAIGGFHWSEDRGRTWSKEMCPEAWRWKEEHEGKAYERGASEGALVRAANGWMVAALRTDLHPRFFGPSPSDNHEGIGVSISKDDGATWSPVQIVHQAGRQHTHLICMPDETLVMTFIMRQDIVDGRLTSYRRGCGALVSYDNGMTWDTEHEYLVHSFDFSDGTPVGHSCGHVYSTLLDDGAILTCYGNFPSKGACLVKWRPEPR